MKSMTLWTRAEFTVQYLNLESELKDRTLQKTQLEALCVDKHKRILELEEELEQSRRIPTAVDDPGGGERRLRDKVEDLETRLDASRKQIELMTQR